MPRVRAARTHLGREEEMVLGTGTGNRALEGAIGALRDSLAAHRHEF